MEQTLAQEQPYYKNLLAVMEQVSIAWVYLPPMSGIKEDGPITLFLCVKDVSQRYIFDSLFNVDVTDAYKRYVLTNVSPATKKGFFPFQITVTHKILSKVKFKFHHKNRDWRVNILWLS